ncbi:MAG: HEAT repeat domain-containing protein [Chloroflexota bacterium]
MREQLTIWHGIVGLVRELNACRSLSSIHLADALLNQMCKDDLSIQAFVSGVESIVMSNSEDFESDLTKIVDIDTIKSDEFLTRLRQAFPTLKEEIIADKSIFRDADELDLAPAICILCSQIHSRTSIMLLTYVCLVSPWDFTRPYDKYDVDTLQVVSRYVHEALENPETRRNAIFMLGQLPNQYSLDTLLSLLENEEDQRSAIKALAFGDDRDVAIKPLHQLFAKISDENDKAQILRTLATITKQKTSLYDMILEHLQAVFGSRNDVLLILTLFELDAKRAEVDLAPYIEKLKRYDRRHLEIELLGWMKGKKKNTQ